MTHVESRLDAGEWRVAPGLYVERGGELVTRHPFDALCARLMVFALPCDAERLQRLCDRTFTAPTDGAESYVPIGESVYVAFTSIGELRSAEPPDDALGSVGEREAAVWVPVYDTRRDRTAWMIPYIFVDAAAPLLGGREIYGFPKQPADVIVSADASSIEVRAHCVDRFAPDARVEQRTVLRATHPDGPAAAAPSEGDADLPGLLREVAGWLGMEVDRPSRAGVRLLGQLARGEVPVVLLKQFRDAADPCRACYQAVVEVEQRLLALSGGGTLGDGWVLDAADLDGQPLVRDLGLPAGPQRPAASFWIAFDFRIGRGRVLWEAR
jgi:hypothetical protein